VVFVIVREAAIERHSRPSSRDLGLPLPPFLAIILLHGKKGLARSPLFSFTFGRGTTCDRGAEPDNGGVSAAARHDASLSELWQSFDQLTRS
jgi:hypothetical protein